MTQTSTPPNRPSRILLIGSGGAGKSTLAIQLGAVLRLPVIHLDRHYWTANWVEPSKADWERTVRQLIARPSWVMDGNYGGTMDLRIVRADTIVFLDRPRYLAIYRVLKRWWYHRGQHRPDMAPGCRERLNWEFLHYVFHYRYTRRPGILQKLARVADRKRVIVLTTEREVQQFMEEMQGLATP
ncbi:MAG: DNA topology modulation protein [Bacteroidota bacterium]